MSSHNEANVEDKVVMDYHEILLGVAVDVLTLSKGKLCLPSRHTLDIWRQLEQEYAGLGYRPVDLEIICERSERSTISLENTANLFGHRLNQGEEPIFYAPKYISELNKFARSLQRV